VQKPALETVLVMQGGGSLGAYECGVYKALVRRGIKFEIVSGTSIGAINAGIIAGSKTGRPAKDLEDFWLHISEDVTPPLSDAYRSVAAATYSALWGNANMFSPVWNPLAPPVAMPYLYDLAPLKKTLTRYVDFSKLAPGSNPRLIVTSTDIQTSESVVFDSQKQQITSDHLVGSAGFPFYGIAWTKVDGRYLWDGSLMSNTPLREVIHASPACDKRVYLVNLFPTRQDKLPENLLDSLHRARDIMYSDKTDHNIRMSRIVKRHLTLLHEMHSILSKAELKGELKERFLKLEQEYHKVATIRGAIIEQVVKIERKEDVHFLFEDADFSAPTIKKLIKQGEEDAEQVLSAQ
jgi:NTE family protein